MGKLHASEDKLRLTPRVSERVWANPNYLRGTPERTPLVSNLVSLDTSEPLFVSQVVQFKHRKAGGRGGIRTLGGFNTTAAFQATALNRYATRPNNFRPDADGK